MSSPNTTQNNFGTDGDLAALLATKPATTRDAFLQWLPTFPEAQAATDLGERLFGVWVDNNAGRLFRTFRAAA